MVFFFHSYAKWWEGFCLSTSNLCWLLFPRKRCFIISTLLAISTLFSTLFSVGKLHISTSEDASFCQLLANGRRLPMPFIYSPFSESFADSFLHWKCHGLVRHPPIRHCQMDFWWSPVTLVGHPTGPIPRILHSLFEANHWMITSYIILWVKTCKYQGDWGSININLIAWYPMFCFVPEWVFKGTHNIGW